MYGIQGKYGIYSDEDRSHELSAGTFTWPRIHATIKPTMLTPLTQIASTQSKVTPIPIQIETSVRSLIIYRGVCHAFWNRRQPCVCLGLQSTFAAMTRA